MRRVGIGADNGKKKSAAEIALEKEIQNLKAEVKQLKADNKKLLKEIEQSTDDQK